MKIKTKSLNPASIPMSIPASTGNWDDLDKIG
jgi:hypothetical protein